MVKARSGRDRVNLVLIEDDDGLTVQLELGAAVLAVDDLVADLDGQGVALAAVEETAAADGDDLALLRLLLGVVRQNDAAGRLLVGLGWLDDDLIAERAQCHGGEPPSEICEKFAGFWQS